MSNMKMMVTVNNTPEVLSKGFVVARYWDGELWYYGKYDSKQFAKEVAEQVDGIVLTIE